MLVPLKSMIRCAMRDTTAAHVAEGFVRVTLQPLQRFSEHLFDFPIRKLIRGRPLLLIRVPRTASVSLAVRIYGRVTSVPHRTALFYQRSDPSFFAGATSIAVVRDPWTRLVSAYNYLKTAGTDVSGPNPEIRRFMSSIRSFEHFVYDYVEPNASSLHTLDPTVQSQHRYVCDDRGQTIVNHIFHFERLIDLDHFLSDRGFGVATEHLNKSTHHHVTEARNLSARLLETIGRVYAEDVRRFGYLQPAAL